MINYIGHLIQIFVLTLLKHFHYKFGWLIDGALYICVYVMNARECVGSVCVAKGDLRQEIFYLLSCILKLKMCTPRFVTAFKQSSPGLLTTLL